MNRAAWLGVLGVALVALPWVAGEFYVNLTSQILIAAVFAASINLLLGYGGLPTLGHASYLGVAAYTSALLALKLGLSHWAAAPVALLPQLAYVILFLPMIFVIAFRPRGLFGKFAA